MTEYTTISIPKGLHEDVQEFLADTNFTSVGEFTKHLLRDMISGGTLGAGSGLTDEEVARVRERLQRLGYLEGSE